jgi:hypothetical protein
MGLGSLVLVCLTYPVQIARAAPPPPAVSFDDQLASGRASEANLDYEEAAEVYLEIVARTDLTDEQRLEANLCAGRVTRIMGKDAEARMYFNYVLMKQPDFRMPADTPPKVANFFELVRQELAAARGTMGTAIAPQPLPANSGSGERAGAATTSPARRSPFPVLLGLGGGVAGIGVIIVSVSGVCGVLSSDAQQRALATDVQTERIARYDERDQYSLVANIGYATAAILLAGGTALVATDLFMGDP